MVKVITYGTFDLFHQGHYNLLKRAKELGDYLIVGVTSESFDRNRGKLNVRDSLMKRIENVRNTGFADEIIVEDYVGQKIDDINKNHVNIFTVGSDWVGHFDYLKEYCEVRYLDRTQGISSTIIRNKEMIRIGIIGAERIVNRFVSESKYVSGISIQGIYDTIERIDYLTELAKNNNLSLYTNFDDFIDSVDAVYICTPPRHHAEYIEAVLKKNKHVICEFPLCFEAKVAKKLFEMAKANNKILFHALKTAYTPAFQKMVSFARSGMIGKILAIDATFTQIMGKLTLAQVRLSSGGSMCAYAEYPLLAIIKLLGKRQIKDIGFYSHMLDNNVADGYTKFFIHYDNAIATATVAINAKSEGSLIVTGTRGYFYVPAPWWKTESFEARFEDVNKNMKYFYKFQGEGLRYEIAEFVNCIVNEENSSYLTSDESVQMAWFFEQFQNKNNVNYF